MKKTILLAAMAACLFATNVFAQKIKGSDTCLPLTQTEAENFMNKNKAAKITVTGWWLRRGDLRFDGRHYGYSDGFP